MISLIKNGLRMLGLLKKENQIFQNLQISKCNDKLDFLLWYNNLKTENDKTKTSHLATSNMNYVEDQIDNIMMEGIVTSLCDQNGLIDHHVYFDMKDFVGFSTTLPPEIGDKVIAECFRRSKGGWRATRVSLVNNKLEWDDTNFSISTHEKRGMMIGVITHLEKENGQIENSVNFSFDDLTFEPVIGDWVQAEIKPGNVAVAITPTLTKKIIGVVTTTPHSYGSCYSGSINHEIFFDLNICLKDYSPKRFDQVAASVIESKQGRYAWRAIEINFISRGGMIKDTPIKTNQSVWVLKGERPEFKTKSASIPSFLPTYAIDDSLRCCIETRGDLLAMKPVLNKPLSFVSYTKRFSALLHLEELAIEKEMQSYKLKDVSLKQKGQFLVLHVPGIYDNNPNLFVGDIVILCPSVFRGTVHHGFIHYIAMETQELFLKYHDQFHAHFNEEELFDVNFTYSRTPFRRCHQAVSLAKKYFQENFLFSDPLDKIYIQKKQYQFPKQENPSDGSERFFINKLLNERQRLAVTRILEGEARSKPYIVFGPPGTGKTVTLVEAILHVLLNVNSSRLLVCAPSNSAVDLLCEHLHDSGKVGPNLMTRFNAFRRPMQAISKNGQIYSHPEETLVVTSHYRLVLTTCSNAGNFHSLKLHLSHFTHVFIDEAGQATEPESLVPLSLGTRGQIVLAGDPQQLGPVLKSQFAQYFNLNVSLLERLMGLKEYKRNLKSFNHGYNPVLVTKLVNNYRSHPTMLFLPSKMFYHNELVACASKNTCNVFCDWEHLPTKHFPVLFHGIVGQQIREDNPSWFNASEVVQVTTYTSLLLQNSLVSPNHLGVITPYRKQVEKIRMMFKTLNINGVKVGSVEEFQGQERKIIIISTVRTIDAVDEISKKYDVKSLLGFISNQKRFNVAITRSQALLIVVGNPFVLNEDKCWNQFLKYCINNKAYVGVDFT